MMKRIIMIVCIVCAIICFSMIWQTPSETQMIQLNAAKVDSTDVKENGLAGSNIDNTTIITAKSYVIKEGGTSASIDIDTAGRVVIDSVLVSTFGTPWDMTDGQYSGSTVYGQAGEALIFGDEIRQHTDGKYYKTDADSLITVDRYPRLSLSTIDANAYGLMLVQGFICESDWTFSTKGGALYTSTSTGAMTQTAPTGDGDRVQAVGKLENTDIIYFAPEHSWVKVTAP